MVKIYATVQGFEVCVTFTDTLLGKPSLDFLYPFSSLASFFPSFSLLSDFLRIRRDVCHEDDFLV